MVGVVCVFILVGYLVLAFTSRKREGPLFEKMGALIYELQRDAIHFSVGSSAVERDLANLFPTMSKEEVIKAYYARKWGMILKIVLVGVILCLAMKCTSIANGGRLDSIPREEVGEGTKRVSVEATVGEEQTELILQVEERQLQREEQECLLQDCIETIEEQLKSEVWKDEEGEWVLPEEISGYPFEILWRKKSSDELEAYFYYGEEMYRHIFFVRKSEDDGKKTLEERLLREAMRLNEETVYEDTYMLPKEVDGKEIVWKKVSEDDSKLILGLILFVAAVVYILKDRDLHEEWNRKKLHMKVSYPLVLSKFVLYMGAGLTVRSSFLRIAKEGQRIGEESIGKEIYQEMFCAAQELSAGVSEVVVYERFGIRTGLEEYTRFTTMLTQNLKKGNGVLLERLREECQKAQTENIHIRKKLGEEAQTKLLLPMVMMMAIVMFLVMIPAFSSL